MKRFLLVVIGTIVVLAGLVMAVLVSIGFLLSPQDTLRPADAIVAISGGDTEARAMEAIKLYKQDLAPKIIFSGAASDPASPSNALIMKRLAISQGVVPSDILIDETSANTLQNAADVTFIARREGYKSIILVTSPYHQRRADVAFAAALGKDVTIINHSTIDKSWRRATWWSTPLGRQLTWQELGKTIAVLLGGPGNSLGL